MPCYRPLDAWRSRNRNENGKRNIVFNVKDGWQDSHLEIPCGQCIGCRLERSRQWAIRCMHEAALYEDNCFLTLTYDNDHLPEDGSLNVDDFQKFMKRLRKRYPDRKIRFFHCGEYGEQNGRPHYHACIFNFDFNDKKLFSENGGNRLYTSQTLATLWPYGFCLIGSVTFESAAYVARYLMKKVTGEPAAEHYQGKKPEYVTMSRRPGIAKLWFDKYKSDVYPHDYVIVNGKKVGVPKFYDKQLSDEELLKIKGSREYEAYNYADNNTYKRLYVREKVKESKIKLLKRSFENV